MAKVRIIEGRRTFTVEKDTFTELDENKVMRTVNWSSRPMHQLFYCADSDRRNIYLVGCDENGEPSEGYKATEAMTEKRGPMARQKGQTVFDYIKKEWSKPSVYRKPPFPVTE